MPRKGQFIPRLLPNHHEKSNSPHRFCRIATKRAIRPTVSAMLTRKEQFIPPLLPNCHEKSSSSHNFCDGAGTGPLITELSRRTPESEQGCGVPCDGSQASDTPDEVLTERTVRSKREPRRLSHA